MLVTTTRYWDDKENSTPDKLEKFVDRALKMTDSVIVAINVEKDRSDSLNIMSKKNIKGLTLLPVRPWGFTSAMNALIYQAVVMQQRFVLSQSVEIELSEDGLVKMREEMDDNTLCVGARLPGHDFRKGEVLGTGITIPWNTCKILNARYYQVYGFPLIGDAAFDPTQAGVEELVANSLAQHLLSSKDHRLKIKLMEIEGIKWKTEFETDPSRRKAHERKMIMKDQRPRLQMGFTGLQPATVLHL